MQSIWLVGLDDSLLRTRAAVLNRTGCRTDCVSPAEFLEKVARQRPDVVVLCHTVAQDRANALGRALHRLWPGTRMLAVQTRCAFSLETGVTEADAVTWSDPERLLRAVAEQMALGLDPSSEPPRPDASAYLH